MQLTTTYHFNFRDSMTQDTTHYYLVSFFERAVGMDKKIIFRSFKEIQTLLERVRTPLTIEMVDCADFNKPSRPFDDWTESRKESKEIAPESHEGLSNEECFPDEGLDNLPVEGLDKIKEVLERSYKGGEEDHKRHVSDDMHLSQLRSHLAMDSLPEALKKVPKG